MFRVIAPAALLLALPPAGRAQEPTATVIRMAVQPAPAPKPALKYQLLPELEEMRPGNPILGYLRCFMEQSNFFHTKQALDEREKFSDMPLKDLPAKDLLNYGHQALRQADYAARLDTPDWQILPKLRIEGIHLLLPDVQEMRSLAWALKVRFRAEVASRRFDDALGTAKTVFALSRHMGEHPTVIADLVAFAIAMQAIEPLEEMIQQPGCPNLYWALTDLPRPLISIRKGLQGERLILAREMARLDEKAPMSAARLREVLQRYYVVVESTRTNVPLERLRAGFEALVKDEAYLRAARQRLVEVGLDAEAVKQFPAPQVVLLDKAHIIKARRDEIMKTMNLPYWQAHALLARRGPAKKDLDEAIVELWLPPLQKTRMAQARLDQRLALLRCVEGLRLYAAEHDGKLPEKLADVPVPLPVDPITGRPFPYSLQGDTAVLRGTPPPGMERSSWYNVRYEVTIRK